MELSFNECNQTKHNSNISTTEKVATAAHIKIIDNLLIICLKVIFIFVLIFFIFIPPPIYYANFLII